MNLDILLFLSNYQWVALTGEKINYSFAETIYGDEFVLIFQKTVGINANGWAKNYLSDIAICLTYMIFFIHTALTLEKVTLLRSLAEYFKKENMQKKNTVSNMTYCFLLLNI